jgi:hypothetical protein
LSPTRTISKKYFLEKILNITKYNASEGFCHSGPHNSSDLLLMLDYGIFYEFIPMDTFGTPDQKVVRLADVSLLKNYAIVITTNSGLWRYLIGDTVRFTLSPYHSSDWQNETPHQCIWRRINGRKYRSGYRQSM